MSETSPPPSATTAPRRRWRKWRLILLAFMLLIVLPAAAVVGSFFYFGYQTDRALEDAIADADKFDPGWRLEDIDKRRRALPLEQNAAVHIKAAAALIPANFLGLKDEEYEIIAETPPQCLLDAEISDKLKNALQSLLGVEAEARKAVPLKSGWYPVQWTPDFYSTLVPHVTEARQVGAILSYLATVQSRDGQHSDAWQTTTTILAVCQSFGEEPSFITMLVRVALRTMTVQSLERCLAQGTVPDSLLAEAQRGLAAEANEPIFLYGVRGERAAQHMMMTNFETGKANTRRLLGTKKGLADIVTQFRFSGNALKQDHVWLLRYFNEAVEAAKLPPVEMRAKLRELDSKAADAPLLAKMIIPAMTRIGDAAAVRSQLFLECAVAGIGVERFRLARDRWPDSLDEVVATKLLDKVPTDHFDGKPLRYRKTSDGVVIHSVGQKGNYAGDALDQGQPMPTDGAFPRVEFRLWDEKHRRQPPRPRPKIDDEKDGDGMPQ